MRNTDPFYLLSSPYRSLRPLGIGEALPDRWKERRGAALVWRLGIPPDPAAFDYARSRPPGVALIVILPPADAIDRPDALLRVAELCRPHSILPNHQRPSLIDLRSVLSRPPEDLPGEVADYLVWRGLDIDLETRRLIRKTLELSSELSTVNGLARALYLSRRALGRRFTTRGLPVPSHWLHFGRVLRASIRLQDRQDTLFAAATALGYPDGFALSNQMVRLIGVRPTLARDRLGWEWILEEWLVREAREDGFSREHAAAILTSRGHANPHGPRHGPSDPPSTRARGRRPGMTGRSAGPAPGRTDSPADSRPADPDRR